MGVALTTLQRWRCEFKADGNSVDGHKGSSRQVGQRLSVEECQWILLTCNEPKYTSLPQGQIVLDLADQRIYIDSERIFYRVCMPMGSCIAVVERNYHKIQSRCPGCLLMAQMRFGVEIFRTY